MRRELATFAGFAACLLLLLPAATLQAQDASEPASDAGTSAVGRGNEGIKAYEHGDWERALDLFRSADALYHSPVFVLYAARSLRNAGRLPEARATYESLVSEQLDAAAPALWRQAQADARSELTALKAPPAQVPTAPPVINTLPTREARRPSGRRTMYVTGWVIAAIGGASLVAGGSVGLLALREKSSALASCQGSTCLRSQEREVERSLETAKRLGTTADVLWIGGAVLATAGVALVIFAPDDETPISAGFAPRGAFVRMGF